VPFRSYWKLLNILILEEVYLELNAENTKLSTRTIKILNRNDIHNLDQLLAFANSRKFFSSSVRGLGRKGSLEIINLVGELEGEENKKRQKFESLIKTGDLKELERSLNSNIDKYGAETITKLFNRVISQKSLE
jgi:hypothetical protein